MIKLDSKKYKIRNLVKEKEAAKIARNLQKQGKRIGLCTGSFDVLHPGHMNHLIASKDLCDILFVAIAKDKYSSSKYPRSKRPLFSHNIRAFMVSELKPVDYVFFDEGVIETVLNLKPDVYIKGKDYCDLKVQNIIEQKKMMESFGGKTVFTRTEKISTTDILKHIKEEIKI